MTDQPADGPIDSDEVARAVIDGTVIARTETGERYSAYHGADDIALLHGGGDGVQKTAERLLDDLLHGTYYLPEPTPNFHDALRHMANDNNGDN